MITIPSVLEVEDVVVFPDNEDCNLFYLLSATPRIRLLEDSTPVFSGLFWTDKANGSVASTAGLAGGTVNFDVNLGVSEKLKEKIKGAIRSAGIQNARYKELQRLERERLTRMAKAQGKTTVPDPDIPKVGDIHFGAIQFKEGEVTLLEEADGKIIEWSSAGGPASLVGNNNAAFAIRLGADGAAIWYKALQQGAKSIGVRYKLVMPVAVESLEIRAYAGSTQKEEINRKAERVWRNVDKGCSDADVERINVKEITRSMMDEGLVVIEIKKGSSQISDEHVSQLRNMMMSLIEEKIKEVIKSRVQGMTEEERRSSLIEVIREEVNSFVELRFSQSDVIDWTVAPQATITRFMEEVPEKKRSMMAIMVDLGDPIVETVEIPINVNALWDEEPFVNVVKVMCEYPAAKKTTSYIFKKGMDQQIWRFRRPKKDDGVVQYWAEVYFKGKSKPYLIPKTTTNGAINIQVGKLGFIDVLFKPHPVLGLLSGSNRINSIQVDTWYKTNEVKEHFTSSVVMTPADLEGKPMERFLGLPIDAPLEYKVKYLTTGFKVVEMPVQKYYITESDKGEIYTPSPFEDMLDLSVEIALTPNDSLKKIIVEFEYQDKENDFQSVESVVLSADDDWEPVSTSLVQMDKAKQDFRYRYKVLSENHMSRSSWIPAQGDQTIILPILPVMVDVGMLGLGDTYSAVIIDLLYEEKENNMKVNDQIFLQANDGIDRFTWYIPRMNPNFDEYSYALTLYDENGNQKQFPRFKGKGRFLIIRDPD